jgi:hypothetical protein
MVELSHQPGYPPTIHFLASVRPQTPDVTPGYGRDCVQVACTMQTNRGICCNEPARSRSH